MVVFNSLSCRFMVLAVLVVGCSGDFDALSGEVNSALSEPSAGDNPLAGGEEPLVLQEPVEEDILALKAIESELEVTEQMMGDVDRQYDRIKDMEKIVFLLNLVFKASQATPDAEPEVTKSLSNPVKSAMEKIMKAVDKVYSFDDHILEKIDALEARLIASGTGQPKILEKLAAAKEKLARFEERLDRAILSMAEKVQGIMVKIDVKMDSYLFFDPRRLLLKKGKDYFERLHNHLINHVTGNASS